MTSRRRLTLSLVSVFAAMIVYSQPLTVRAQTQACSSPYYIEQRFPIDPNVAEETRWRFCWRRVLQNGLVINDAYFRKSPSSPWVQVIYDARVIEFFVPYHSGSPRFLDMSGYNFELYQMTSQHCPRLVGGTLLDNRYVCKELHDRGLAWAKDGRARRGEEVVLWGLYKAANYNYVIEWTFRDDGVMLGRVGATATNHPPSPLESHMHGIYWRLDLDFNGASGDSVGVVSHTEGFFGIGPWGFDNTAMMSTEGSRVWSPTAFTSLHVHDSTLKNSQGHLSGYHLVPIRTGTPRHQENFTKADFWVTRYKPTEMYVPSLPAYISPAEPVSNNDVVVWYYSAAHHTPRDEDGRYVNNRFEPTVAQVMWTGFMLKPHNLFDQTPLYP